jgi:hypothetical protein
MFHIRSFQITAREKFLELFHTEWLSNSDTHHLKSFFALHGIRMTYATQNNMLLYNFKYGQTCVFDAEWKYACRGTTLGYKDGKWTFSVFGLPKFFNEGEISKQMGMEFLPMLRDIEDDGYKLVFMNKEDGSNLRFWYDETGYLHAYTLGTVTEHKMQPNIQDSPTFTELGIYYFRKLYPALDTYLKENPGVVFFAELISKWNLIVTKYDFGTENGMLKPLVLIGLDGVPSWSVLQSMYPEFYKDDLPLYSSYTTVDTYFADRDKYFEWQAANPSLVGVVPEGCVLYAVKPGECFPVSKGKSDPYKKIHLGITLNVGSSVDFMNAQRNEILGKYDDAVGELGQEERDAHIHVMRTAINKLAMYLDEFLPSLIQHKFAPASYAEIVKKIGIRDTLYLGWITSYLYAHKYELTEDTDAVELIYKSLSSIQNGSCLLDDLHKKNGLTWWIYAPKVDKPKVEKKEETVDEPVIAVDPSFKVAVFDFDLTLVGESLPSSTDGFVCNPQIVQTLHTYYALGAIICILTGRDLTKQDAIVAYLSTIISCPMEFYFREPGTSIFLHKVQTIRALSARFGSVYHFEDDSNILNASSGIVLSRGSKYIGHVITDGWVSNIITSQKTSLLITLVDAPGTGKTSIFKEVEKQVGNVTWVSPDRISTDYKRMTGEKIPPDIMYAKLKKQFKKGAESGGVVLIDTCNNKPEFIKDILASGHKYIIGTFMLTSETKKKGKSIQVIHPDYVDFIRKNVTKRIEDKHAGKTDAMNGSTLDCITAVDIALEKAGGCLHQITSRDVKRFAMTSLTVDEKVVIMMQHIRDMLSQITTTMIHAKLTTSDGTVVTDTTELYQHLHELGPAVFI